jgi:hypothetical protein
MERIILSNGGSAQHNHLRMLSVKVADIGTSYNVQEIYLALTAIRTLMSSYDR